MKLSARNTKHGFSFRPRLGAGLHLAVKTRRNPIQKFFLKRKERQKTDRTGALRTKHEFCLCFYDKAAR